MARTLGFLAVIVVALACLAAPASAEFFGCNDPGATAYSRGLSNTRSYSSNPFAAQNNRQSRRVSHAWSARSRW